MGEPHAGSLHAKHEGGVDAYVRDEFKRWVEAEGKVQLSDDEVLEKICELLARRETKPGC